MDAPLCLSVFFLCFYLTPVLYRHSHQEENGPEELFLIPEELLQLKLPTYVEKINSPESKTTS